MNVRARRAALPTLRDYRRAYVQGDLVAGATVAALVLPLGMALAVTAGLPAETGLYGSLVSLIAFALVSSSRRTMIGPDASVTALVLAAVLPLSGGGQLHRDMVAMLCLLAGVLCIGAALAGAARLATILTEAALVGYLAGLAVVVAISQLPRLGGMEPADSDRALVQLGEFVVGLPGANGWSLAIAVSTIVLVLLGRRSRPGLPWMLVALVGAGMVTWLIGATEHGIALVGDLPSGLPRFALPDLSLGQVVRLLPVAAAVVVVTFADTLATSAAFAHRHGEEHEPGRDLVGLGLADIASGLVGAIPASASGARTAAADTAGARSQLSGLIAALVIALALVGGAGSLEHLPMPALGGIVVAAVVPMVDIQSLARMRRLDHPAFAAALVVVGVVVVIGVVEGIVAAFIVSLVERRMSSRRAAGSA